ncbi:hypothetical protein Tco_0379679 [Tanacetum coccineum]
MTPSHTAYHSDLKSQNLLVSDQAKEIKLLKAKINKLKKQAKPVIKHHKEYLRSVSLKQRFPRKASQRNIGCTKSLYPNKGGEAKGVLKWKELVSDFFEKVSSEGTNSNEEQREVLKRKLKSNEGQIKEIQLLRWDEEMARKEFKKNGIAEELRILAKKLKTQEREQFTIEERAKFLHDTIVAQRKFLAQQRSEAIRNRPPTKNQLRNQMMTYLKHGQMKITLLLGLLNDDRLPDQKKNKKISSEEKRSSRNLKKKSRKRIKEKRTQERESTVQEKDEVKEKKFKKLRSSKMTHLTFDGKRIDERDYA